MQSVLSNVVQFLETSDSANPHVPPTLFHNEGWLLRLCLQAGAIRTPCLPFRFANHARWFSEALLYSAFLPRYRGDRLAESWTHADGVVGHFHFDQTKAGVVLDPAAEQFVVCEAKVFSGLSKGTTRAPEYDQAARNVACMAWTLKRAGRPIGEYKSLGFFVFAPQQQIAAGVFGSRVTPTSIREKIAARIAQFEEAWRIKHLEPWHRDWVSPLLERIELGVVSWESLLDRIRQEDASYGAELQAFYRKCLRYCAAISAAEGGRRDSEGGGLTRVT